LLVLVVLTGLVPLVGISWGGAREDRTARLVVGRSWVAAGQRLFVRGVAFPGNSTGRLDLASAALARPVQVAALETNGAGTFSGTVRVPSVPAGAAQLRATVGSVTASVTLTVVAPGTGEPPATSPTTAPTTTTTTTTRPPTTTTTAPPGPTTTAAPPVAGKPGPTNTGFRVPESGLRVVGTPGQCLFASQLGVGDGGTISGYRVRGRLALDRGNLRVVDNWLEGGISVTLGCGVGLKGAGALIEHNEIGPRPGTRGYTDAVAIGDSNFTARYNRVQGFEDGCRCNSNVVFERNWVANLATNDDAHNDAVQLTDNGSPAAGWGGPTYIRFNALEVAYTQNAAIQAKADTGPVGYLVVIEGNWLAGGGYTLYGGGEHAVDVRIINNIWERTFFRCSGAYGPVIYLPPPGRYTWVGNRWADGGELPPSPNAC
jgi:hypothetical protein